MKSIFINQLTKKVFTFKIILVKHMKKKIEINDRRWKNIFYAVVTSAIVFIVLIFAFKKVIKNRISKEITTEENFPIQEIEWLVQEYEDIINIEEIIQKNIEDEIKTVIETQVVELEYQTEYQNTSSLPIGTIKILSKGEDGKQELVIKKQYKGKTLIADEQIGRIVITPAINKIVQIGKGSFQDVLNNNNNVIEYSKRELLQTLNKNMQLNKPSGLTLEQFKKIFEGESKDRKGVFKENAEYFYYIEQAYGINGVFVAAIGIHESAWGTSKISTNKKNLFGYGAYDMNAYSSAYEYSEYRAGIDMIARVLIKNYLNPKGTVVYNNEIATGRYYNGTTLSSVNKKYATDKKWADSVYTWMCYLYNRL